MSHSGLEELLCKEEPIKLLYFFCHATTVGTYPFSSASSMDGAKISIDDTPISLAEMRKLRQEPLPGAPLVFLNACSSAQGDRAFQSPFVEHFIRRWAARGVVGTEWEVPTAFGDLFARRVLSKLLVEGLPLGDSFHEVIVEAMKEGNPFGLIYAIYASPEIVAIYPEEKQ